MIDRRFAAILRLVSPRVRHFTRHYGLIGHAADAEQCCAIAVHRALASYDPAKAQFTTFLNWQIRGELQALRFRLMIDQREPARKVGATTVSLQALGRDVDGEPLPLEAALEDETALSQTEAGAADYLADRAIRALLAAWEAEGEADGSARAARDRALAAARLFDIGGGGEPADIGPERARQIVRRGAAEMAAIARRDPRFAMMAAKG